MRVASLRVGRVAAATLLAVWGLAASTRAEIILESSKAGSLTTDQSQGFFTKLDDPMVGSSLVITPRYHRAFAVFDTSVLTEDIASIALFGDISAFRRNGNFTYQDNRQITVDAWDVSASADDLIAYDQAMGWDLGHQLYDDLGGGDHYGQFTVDNGIPQTGPTGGPPPPPPLGPQFEILLSPSAIASLNAARLEGRQWAIGFRSTYANSSNILVGDVTAFLRLTPVPEPGAASLLAVGLAALAFARRWLHA